MDENIDLTNLFADSSLLILTIFYGQNYVHFLMCFSYGS